MPIQENAINAALAEVLTSLFDVHATPEQTRKKTGKKRCDVQIRHKHDDRYFTAVECKIGQDSSKKKSAREDAKRWVREADCLSAIALCYPKEISLDSRKTPKQKLEASSNLLMAKVARAGVTSEWHLGSVADLVKLAGDTGANETSAVTGILKHAITVASELIDATTGKDLSKALGLPWDPGQKYIDPRPARIACLILANTALLQNRMHSQGIRIPKLKQLITIRRAANKQTALLDSWRKIREVDYAPVVDPAILVLETLPSDSHTESLLETLIESVLECAQHIHDFRLDHAGPLYHELLQTARYDGSYYTSTAASVLLAELAMPEDWCDWADTNRIDGLKICDPACGTGTLLMASARTIEERYRATSGGGG